MAVQSDTFQESARPAWLEQETNLEKVVKLCPGTPQAEGAVTRIAQIKNKTPTTAVQFQKP